MRATGHLRIVGLAVLATVLPTGCARTAEVAAKKKEPYTSEKVGQTGLSRITLEEQAARRIGVKTAPVDHVGDGAGPSNRWTVPYGAVIYTADGAAWVYTNPQGLTFVRQPVAIDHIDGDVVLLREGPPAGTAVVTEGTAELTGIEFGVGK